MNDIKLNKFAIRISKEFLFDYQIDCTIDTPDGKVIQGFSITKNFLNPSGLDWLLNETIKEYQDATKKSR